MEIHENRRNARVGVYILTATIFCNIHWYLDTIWHTKYESAGKPTYFVPYQLQSPDFVAEDVPLKHMQSMKGTDSGIERYWGSS